MQTTSRTPCAIRALLLGKRLSVAVDTSALGKVARAAAEVDPGDGQGCRSEKARDEVPCAIVNHLPLLLQAVRSDIPPL